MTTLSAHDILALCLSFLFKIYSPLKSSVLEEYLTYFVKSRVELLIHFKLFFFPFFLFFFLILTLHQTASVSLSSVKGLSATTISYSRCPMLLWLFSRELKTNFLMHTTASALGAVLISLHEQLFIDQPHVTLV